MKNKNKVVAYFSMEIALESDMPNYAGGLGVLAGDTMLSCADLRAEVVGITLIYHLDNDPQKKFDPEKFLTKLAETVSVEIEGREVKLAVWEKKIISKNGYATSVYFLSSDLPENTDWDRDLTKNMYPMDRYNRLAQEVILGVGGVRLLEKLGHEVKCYHMNEGHSALLTLELLKKFSGDMEKVKSLCTFTTHTPISAGHDYFDYDLAEKVLGDLLPANIKNLATAESLGMTQLALSLSRKYNAVSRKHQEVCNRMFPGYKFHSITNGIYHLRWTGSHTKKVLDEYVSDWEADPTRLKSAVNCLPADSLMEAKKQEKQELVSWINSHWEYFLFKNLEEDDYFENDTLTIGFARRFVQYKRPALILSDLSRLRKIGFKKIQIIFACRYYLDNQFYEEMVSKIKEFANELRSQVKIVFIPNYNLDVAKHLIAGCDIWLNNPLPPLEASGTSGMKAALNGTLNFSTVDGWWLEAYKADPFSGWAINEENAGGPDRDQKDFESMMANLEKITDCYYNLPEEWTERMKHAIGLVAYFNTHRLVKEYLKMWNNG